MLFLFPFEAIPGNGSKIEVNISSSIWEPEMAPKEKKEGLFACRSENLILRPPLAIPLCRGQYLKIKMVDIQQIKSKDSFVSVPSPCPSFVLDSLR